MNWLQSRLKELDITQDELAARLQVEGLKTSRSTVSAWVTGRNNVPFKNMETRRALAKALKLSTREMLRMAGYETETTNHTKEGELAAILIDQMTPEDREKILKIVETLAG